MIKFILTVLFVTLFLILTIPLMLIMWILGKFKPEAADRASLAIVNWAFRVCIFFSGVDKTIIGEENVPKDEPVLYIANHQSFYDIIITYTRVPRPTGYVAKKEIKKVPLLNVWMMLLHCKFLDRKHVKEGMKTILSCIDDIKAGRSITIFPEGTRNKNEDVSIFGEFHEGSFKVASKSGCAIVPICVCNTVNILEAHFPRVKKQHVIIEYGKPFYVKDLEKEDQKAVGAYTQKLIHDMYEKNRELI